MNNKGEQLVDITKQQPGETRSEWKERTFFYHYGGGISTVLPPKRSKVSDEN